MIYRPLSGSPLTKESAQIVGEALESMAVFSPADVLDSARPALSPLHKFFEWDDVRAAEKHRIHQARQLINHVAVLVRVGNREVETRAFHSITSETADGMVEARYTAIKVIAANVDMRQQVVEKALAELEHWHQRHQQYSAIFGDELFEEIKKASHRVRTRSQTSPAVSVQPTV